MGLLTSFIKVNPGGGQWPYLQTYDPIATSAGSITANAAYLSLVMVHKPTTITTMGYLVGTASGNVDLGIYTYDGTTFTRVASTGNTAASGSSAVQEIALTAAYTMQPGVRHYFGFSADNGTITAQRTSVLNSVNHQNRGVIKTVSQNPLPASIASPLSAGGAILWLMAR